jgi:hypothetical protein
MTFNHGICDGPGWMDEDGYADFFSKYDNSEEAFNFG